MAVYVVLGAFSPHPSNKISFVFLKFMYKIIGKSLLPSKVKKEPWARKPLGGCLTSSPGLVYTHCTVDLPGELLKKNTDAQAPHQANWVKVFGVGTRASPRGLNTHLALRTAALAGLGLWPPYLQHPPYHLQGRPSLIWPICFSNLLPHHSLESAGSRHTWHRPVLASLPLYSHGSFCPDCCFPNLLPFQLSAQNCFLAKNQI